MYYAIGVTTFDNRNEDEYRILTGFEPGAAVADEYDQVFGSREDAEEEMQRRMASDPHANVDPTGDYSEDVLIADPR